MRDPTQFQELKNWGEDEEIDDGGEYREKKQGSGSVLPLLQTLLCALTLLALMFLKVSDVETYGKVTNWYREEAAREIELPKWSGTDRAASVVSSPALPEVPDAAKLKDGSLQKV